jgi:luciferase family oxidoreductase group 1
MDVSILEQSLIRAGGDARTALAETLRLARHVEELGYKRLWVSEHHDSPVIAGSSPEVLLAAIGAATSRIRIGSGGVMLPHYSAYKVAENFAVLSNLYPGRIDLGVGRAPGADMSTAMALATDGKPKFERFPQLVQTLMQALTDPEYRPRVSPRPAHPIPVWMLGSSPDSAILAAQLGLPYSVALFINPQFDPRVVELYRRHFRPSAQQGEPRVMIAINVLASDSRERAAAMSHAANLTYIRFITGRGNFETIPPEQAVEHSFNPQERDFLRGLDAARASGTAEDVRAKAARLASQYQADEIMAVCNTYYFEDRLRSFELFAQAMG